MDFFAGFGNYVIPFLVFLTVLVFVHEWGHYWVARRNGVRVEVFSIGFGPEIFGRTDRAGTRWKFSAIPLGGYVRMFGEASFEEGEARDGRTARDMTEDEKSVSFSHKRLGQRAAIVAAGPAANFIFAIIVLAGLFAIAGQPFTPADVGRVESGTAAAEAGMQPGDLILAIDGAETQRFEEVQHIVQLNPGLPLDFLMERDGAEIHLTVTPQIAEVTDRFGNVHRIGRIGVWSSGTKIVRHDPLTATWQATRETWRLTTGTLTALGQIILGTRSVEELGGPIRIAKMSGEVSQTNVQAMIKFIAYLSINLGLINLFPIPMLDGGHLLFYIFEGLRGRPLGPRAQEYGFRIGLALVLSLMLFVTWNDLTQLPVVEFIKGLFI